MPLERVNASIIDERRVSDVAIRKCSPRRRLYQREPRAGGLGAGPRRTRVCEHSSGAANLSVSKATTGRREAVRRRPLK